MARTEAEHIQVITADKGIRLEAEARRQASADIGEQAVDIGLPEQVAGNIGEICQPMDRRILGGVCVLQLRDRVTRPAVRRPENEQGFEQEKRHGNRQRGGLERLQPRGIAFGGGFMGSHGRFQVIQQGA